MRKKTEQLEAMVNNSDSKAEELNKIKEEKERNIDELNKQLLKLR